MLLAPACSAPPTDAWFQRHYGPCAFPLSDWCVRGCDTLDERLDFYDRYPPNYDTALLLCDGVRAIQVDTPDGIWWEVYYDESGEVVGAWGYGEFRVCMVPSGAQSLSAIFGAASDCSNACYEQVWCPYSDIEGDVSCAPVPPCDLTSSR